MSEQSAERAQPRLRWRAQRAHRRCRTKLPTVGRFGDRAVCVHGVMFTFTTAVGWAGGPGWTDRITPPESGGRP